MEVDKLYKILKELNDKIIALGIQGQFTIISQNLQKLNVQTQIPPQTRQQILAAIENAKRVIDNAINTLIPVSISEEDSKIYDAIGAYSLFGFEGQERFNKGNDIFGCTNFFTYL